jgi:hypothetical protein
MSRSLLLVALMIMSLLAPWGVTKAVADQGGDRIGCGTFCQSAGGYGATASSAPPASTIISNGTVTADSDGYVPVTVKCNLSAQCSGAILFCLRGGASADPGLSRLGMAGYCGRSDLMVNAGATRTIGVPFPAAALAFLRSHGPTPAVLSADASQSAGVGTAYQTLASTTLTVAAS